MKVFIKTLPIIMICKKATINYLKCRVPGNLYNYKVRLQIDFSRN